MERDRTLVAIRVAIRAALAAAAASLLLAGCGPGTGGTGLPPGSDTAQVDAALPSPVTSPVTSPGPQPSTGTVAAPRPLPSRAPDLDGTIDRVDDATLSIAGSALPRAATDVVLADGSAAPADAARAGRAARAWLENGRWLVVLP
jgi:hypothetical protein